MKYILIFIIALTTNAYAQSDPNAVNRLRTSPGPIGQAIRSNTSIGDDAEDLFNKIRQAKLDDLKFALKVANSAGTPSAKLASTCWQAWITVIENDGRDDSEQPPEPHVITTVTRLMILHDNLQPESPFMVACAPLIGKLKTNVRSFIGTVIAGGAGLGKLLPAIP